MKDEKQPLLVSGSAKQNGYKKHDSSSDSSSESVSVTLESSVKVPIYGTSSEPIGKSVPADDRITYSWSDINVFALESGTQKRKFPFWRSDPDFENGKRKHILKGVNGIAYPGELLAILGSSGAGKSTLLNALTFRYTKNVTVTGSRCVNGKSVNSRSLTSHSAYVQQDDLFIGSLTVREHLIFQALVRMDRSISYEDRMKRVEEVLSELALKKCQNTTIGHPGRIKGISGGEKKRLSFAAEVLTNPPLMFCDEPTSGLDSFMALNVVQVLQSMAQAGKTVICTIHQPSSELFSMFDKLLLMSEGKVAFLGTPGEADLFFTELESPCPKNYNPADYFIQLLAIVPGREESCRQAIKMICDKYEKSDVGVKMHVEAASSTASPEFDDIWLENYSKSPYKASWCAQFRAVLWRSFLSIIKEPLLVKVRFLQTLMLALIIGSIYFGQVVNQDGIMNINGVLFIFMTTTTFQNVFAVINVFCSELPIFLREHRNGMYRTDVYFLSKTIAETPIFVVIPILFVSVVYYMVGLNPEQPRFFINWGIIILVTNVSTSFGYMISCVAGNTSMALSLGPPLIIPFLLFGGFFLNVRSIPIYFKWLSYLSWFRYGYEAVMINQWENVTNIACPDNSPSCLRDGHVVLDIYSFHEDNFYMDVISLGCLIAGFRLVAYFNLLWKAYKQE